MRRRIVGSWLNTNFQTGLETGLMYLPDGNEVKGAAVVCRACHVFQHSLNTYFHCNALKAAVIWQTETGKAMSCVGVACEELHTSFVRGASRGREEVGRMCKRKCLSNTGAKTPLIFYHLTTRETYSYLQTNMNSTDLSSPGLWTRNLFHEGCPMTAGNAALHGTRGLPMWGRWQNRNLSQLKTICGMWEGSWSQLRLGRCFPQNLTF